MAHSVLDELADGFHGANSPPQAPGTDSCRHDLARFPFRVTHLLLGRRGMTVQCMSREATAECCGSLFPKFYHQQVSSSSISIFTNRIQNEIILRKQSNSKACTNSLFMWPNPCANNEKGLHSRQETHTSILFSPIGICGSLH